MQIDMNEEATAHGCNQPEQRRRFFHGTVLLKPAVRIKGIRIPPVDAFVSPWANAWDHEYIDPSGIVCGSLLEELQRAAHTARFVTVHATSDERDRKVITPTPAADRI